MDEPRLVSSQELFLQRLVISEVQRVEVDSGLVEDWFEATRLKTAETHGFVTGIGPGHRERVASYR